MSNNDPKVTECWAQVALAKEFPCAGAVSYDKEVVSDRPAILIWKEDYEQLKASLKHREELYWKLTAEFDAMRGELEELRTEASKWKAFEQGHYKQEGKMVYFCLSSDRHTEDHD
jgi:hypothetical protein